MQKTIWRKIANIFHENGYNITEEQCNIKWRNLKRRYKNVRDRNNQTGKGTEHWEYFDVIEEFINTRPEIEPLSVASSTHGFRTQSGIQQIEETTDENDSAAINTSGNMKRNIRKRRKTGDDWTQKLYEQKETHHKESIKRQDRFLTLFEKYMQRKEK